MIERTYTPHSATRQGIECLNTETGQTSLATVPFGRSELSAILSGDLDVVTDPLGIWEIDGDV